MVLDGRAIAVLFGAVAFALAAFGPGVLDDGNSYLHVIAGRWMLENQSILRIDPFSYTFGGHPWLTHEWLSEVVEALAYIAGGWSGYVFLHAAAVAAAAGLLAWHLSRRLGGVAVVIAMIVSLGCLAGHLPSRPHLLALPLLELWTAGIVFASDDKRTPPVWLLPVMALWANVDGSFIFGLVLLLPFTLEAVLGRRGDRFALIQWGSFALLSLGAAMLTPHGLYGLFFPFKQNGTSALSNVDAWTSFDPGALLPLLLAVAFTLAVLLLRGVKIGAVRIAILLCLLCLCFVQARNQVLLAIVGPLLLAAPLAKSLDYPPFASRGRPYVLAGSTLVLLALCVLRLALVTPRGDGFVTPANALAHVPATLAGQPVLNEDRFGGYLIFKGVRPFIDGRVELYGDGFVRRYMAMMHPDERQLARTLERYHVAWTILAPENPAVGVLDGMKGWHRLYADRWAVVHVRNDGS
jgi:hypothetical protein